MADDDDEFDSTPLEDVRPFVRSRARQPLTFVPAGSTSDGEPAKAAKPASRVVDNYLATVLRDKRRLNEPDETTAAHAHLPTPSALPTSPPSSDDPTTTCPICHIPLGAADAAPHAATLAHQVCVAHAPPPSHLNRAHFGVRNLIAHGWDPDARRGLGAHGSGIAVPIKATPKPNTAGIGVSVRKAQEGLPKREVLDAGKIRKRHAEEKKKEARLREHFYGDDKIARYLGSG